MVCENGFYDGVEGINRYVIHMRFSDRCISFFYEILICAFWISSSSFYLHIGDYVF